MTAHRRRKGGRYTPRAPRSGVVEAARQQAERWGCRCKWELSLLQHRDGYTYAQVHHDADCPAANRRGLALVWPAGGGHGN